MHNSNKKKERRRENATSNSALCQADERAKPPGRRFRFQTIKLTRVRWEAAIRKFVVCHTLLQLKSSIVAGNGNISEDGARPELHQAHFSEMMVHGECCLHLLV